MKIGNLDIGFEFLNPISLKYFVPISLSWKRWELLDNIEFILFNNRIQIYYHRKGKRYFNKKI